MIEHIQPPQCRPEWASTINARRIKNFNPAPTNSAGACTASKTSTGGVKREEWILTFYERAAPKSRVYKGSGWENAAITFFGDAYEVAQANWDKYQAVLRDIEKLPPRQLLKNPGFRPTTVAKLRSQLHAEWGAFKASFLRRLTNDRQTLQEGLWPIPELWPFP